MIIIAGKSNIRECDYFPETDYITAAGNVEVNSPSAIVVTGENFNGCLIQQAFAVIVSGDYICGKLPAGVEVLTCGISGKNTFSVTSRSHDRITVSLNRTIKTTYGTTDPMEIPVKLRSSEFDCIAAVACRLLLQNNL